MADRELQFGGNTRPLAHVRLCRRIRILGGATSVKEFQQGIATGLKPTRPEDAQA